MPLRCFRYSMLLFLLPYMPCFSLYFHDADFRYCRRYAAFIFADTPMPPLHYC